MLSKLIKYEFRATRRTMLPLLFAVLLFSVIGGFSVNGLDMDNMSPVLELISIISLCVYVCLLIATSVVALIIMLNRFRANLLGNEGYLMFTLPCSVHSLVWSKLIVSCVWFILTAIVSLISILIMAVIGSNFELTFKLFANPELWGNLEIAIRSIGTVNFVTICLELIFSIIIGCMSSCLQFYLAVSIGYSFANHKQLYSILAFFGISIVVSFIGNLFAILGGNSSLIITIINSITPNESIHQIQLVFLASLLTSVLMCAIYYVLTIVLLKKKLNLE